MAIFNAEIVKKENAIIDRDDTKFGEGVSHATKSMKHLHAKALQMKALVNLTKWENH